MLGNESVHKNTKQILQKVKKIFKKENGLENSDHFLFSCEIKNLIIFSLRLCMEKRKLYPKKQAKEEEHFLSIICLID